ncbi:MAG: branched-chain amino acid ABC transporter permease [Desulfobacteria bacterium]
MLATVIAAFLLPLGVGNPYVIHILIIMFLNIVLAMGLTLIFKGGALSFGHAAYAGIGAYTSVLLVTRLGFPFWIAFLSAGAVTALMALFIGGITLGVRGIYFTITTFALTEVLRGAYMSYPSLFGGPGGISGIPSPPGITSKMGFYYLALVFSLVSFFIFNRITNRKSSFGIVCDGLKLNEVLEESLGINTKKVRISVFAIGCAFAGFSGSIMAHYLGQINPDTFGIHTSVDVIVFCAAGGFGNIYGAVFGSVVLTILGELLYGIGNYKSMVFGGILVLIVLFLPGGIMGLFSRNNAPGILKRKITKDASPA